MRRVPPRRPSQILDFLVRANDRLPFDQLASHHFSLNDINDAFQRSEWNTGETPVIRAVLTRYASERSQTYPR